MTETVSTSKEKFIFPKSIPWKRLAIAAGVFFVIVFLVWIIPTALALYYQNQGGTELRKIVTEIDEYQAVTTYCYPPILTDEQRANIEDARDQLEKSAAIKPNYTQTALLLGRANCLLGETELAVEKYKRYTDLRPDHPLGYIELALALEFECFETEDLSKLGEICLLELDTKKLWEMAGISTIDIYQMGEHLLKEKQLKNALQWISRAVAYAPEWGEAWYSVSLVYNALNDLDNEAQALQTAWRYDAELSTQALAESFQTQGDYQAMEEVLQEALANFPSSDHRLTWWLLLGEALQAQDAWSEARSIYREALQEFPIDPNLHIGLGWAYYYNGDGLRPAQNAFEQAIALDEAKGDGYFAIGQLMVDEEMYTEADEWFQMALERNPDKRWWYLTRANAARSGGNYLLALQIYDETTTKFPDYAASYYEMAWAYYLDNQADNAITAIEKAIDLTHSPKPWFYIRAGRIYEQAKKNEEALAAYRQAVEIAPDNEDAIAGIERLSRR